jgi:thiamine-phosphate pyrophosphorylase
MKLDLSLYLVTDRRFCRGRSLTDMVYQAVRGGVTAVQLREKNSSPLEILELAKSLKNLLTPLGIPLIVNDFPELAKASGAQGVHLGASDAQVLEARALLGPQSIIGFSVESHTDLTTVPWSHLDYFAASPVYPTLTKEDAPEALGSEGVARLRKASSLPLVGIGGINPSNIADILRAGLDGVAVVSAILDSEDIYKSTFMLRSRIQEVHNARR